MKKSVLFGAFALASAAVALGCGADAGACADGDGRCPAGCAAANDNDCGVDTSGTWYAKVSATGKLQVTGLASISSSVTVSSWIRTYVSPGGDVTFSICKLAVQPAQGAIFTATYSQAFLDTLHTTSKLGGDSSIQVGGAVSLPSFTIYSGQTADGTPVDTPPPTFPSGDGDGLPGVTINIGLGSVSIDTYIGIAIATNMSGVKLTDATTMTGNASIATRVVVIDSSYTALVPKNSSFDVSTDEAGVPFNAKKLDGDGSTPCAAIANMQ